MGKKEGGLYNYGENVRDLFGKVPFFYDKNLIFWKWCNKEFKYILVDYLDLLVILDDLFELKGACYRSKVKTNYIDTLKFEGRKNLPKNPPPHWVQFKEKIYDLENRKIFFATPDYFHTNPIPFNVGKSTDTPIMDRMFEEWVGKDYAQDLFEILAYCCYRGYPIQMLFCFVGSGRNGKSQFMNILNHFLGKQNTTASELDILLSSRFESFKLYRKLVCSIGETNFGVLSQSSLLKKLVGGDLISFEMKNKQPFDDNNYAKILINSNSLPTSTDTSDGFYRRWYIIDFPNEFEETGRDVWLDVPVVEYENLCRKIVKILPRLLNKGKFNNQGTIEERRNKYIQLSNPFSFFIEEQCIIDSALKVKYNDLYNEYLKYLVRNKRRRVTRREFKISIEDQGFLCEKASHKNEEGSFENVYWVYGLSMKQESSQVDDVNEPKVEEEYIVTKKNEDWLYKQMALVGGMTELQEMMQEDMSESEFDSYIDMLVQKQKIIIENDRYRKL